jgi:hypothetical protein
MREALVYKHLAPPEQVAPKFQFRRACRDTLQPLLARQLHRASPNTGHGVD